MESSITYLILDPVLQVKPYYFDGQYVFFFISERKNEPVRECCAPPPPVIVGEASGCGRCGLPPNQYPCSEEHVPCFGIPTADQAASFLQNCGDESEEFIEKYCLVEKTFYDYMMAEGTVEIIFG